MMCSSDCFVSRRLAWAGGLVTLLLPIALGARAQSDFLPTIPQGDVEVRLDLFASGLNGNFAGVNQTFASKLVALPDGSGRNLVSTFGGLLRVVDNDGNFLDAPQGGAYLNTNTAATDIGPFAFGLTSVAVHPDFATAGAEGFGKIYALVTEEARDSPGDYDFSPVVGSGNQHAGLLVEYTVDPSAIGDNRLFTEGPNQNVTRRELFSVQQPDNEHNLGDLAFDAQGLLYVSTGDGFFEFNGGVNDEAQNAAELGSVLGKVLRIDPTGDNSANGQYGIVADNVFAADGDDGTLGEIFSYGHRNPFRLSVDTTTDTVVVGEVGHFNIEEVNIAQNGRNYGWPFLEGTFLINPDNGFDLTFDADTNNNGVGDFAEANNLTEPVFQYDHQDGVSVTGGFVYRGSDIPELFGQYVFADFQGAEGDAPRLFYGDLETGLFSVLQISAEEGLGGLPGNPLSFSVDADGELLVLFTGGQIARISAIPEPGSACGLLLLAGLVGRRRRARVS